MWVSRGISEMSLLLLKGKNVSGMHACSIRGI
jgi:hypothetical protein